MDEDFKKALTEIPDKQFEDTFIKMFNRGFEEVVQPQIKEFRREMATKETGVRQIDKKLDLISAKVADHDQQLESIESIPATAHDLKK